MNISPRKLQHTYSKHAGEFGVVGPWNAANGRLLEQAIRGHVANNANKAIAGTYRGSISVIHYLDPSNGLWVAVDSAGDFVAGWKLSVAQKGHLLTTGNIQ